MKRTFLWLTIVLTFLCPRVVLAGGKASNLDFRQRVQNKIDNQSVNIQYEPYYLEKESPVSVSESRQQNAGYQRSEYWGDAAKAQRPQKPREKSCAGNPELPGNPVLGRYAIYQTHYKAELEDNVVIIDGKVVFEVFRKGWTQLPLVGTDVGLIDANVNRGSAFVTMRGGKYYLMIDRPGRYTLNLEFLIKASREREFGPGNFKFDVVPAPISQFEFTIPEKEVEIFVEPAIKVEVKREADKTVAWAVMPNTSHITARWTKAIPKENIQPVELQPKVYADTATHVSIGEGIIRSQSRINYSILQAEVSTFRIALPEDVSLLDVRGKDLRDWKLSKADGVQYLDVYLNFGVRGNYSLDITTERNIGEGSVIADIPWIRTTGTERERGYFGIAARTNVELAVDKVDHATTIDVKELPSSIWGHSSSPILLAFKYLNHPYGITIDVTRHEEMPVLVAAIDAADFFTLYTKDGKLLTRATYQVRNNVKQFLRLNLPKGATLWSTFVADKPVKPAKDKNGSIMVPLEKSRLQGESLTGFPVEIVYLNEGPKMYHVGQLKMRLPRVDIPISEIQWSAYFPSEYSYFDFGGDVNLATGPSRRLFPVLGLTRGIQGRLRAASDEIGVQQSVVRRITTPRPQTSLKREYDKELEDIRSKGILPIKISFPARGRHFRFVKLLVTEQESPELTLRYTDLVKKYGRWVKLAIVGLFFLMLFRFIRNRRSRRKRAAPES